MTALKHWPLLGFLVATIAAGAAYGTWTDRWGRSADREVAVERLATIPRELGGWVGTDVEISGAEVHRAGIDGYVLRTYQHPKTAQRVTLLVVCGRPGPVSVHTPDVCFQGSGYELTTVPAREPVSLGEGTATVWSTVMRKSASVLPDTLSVRWAWRTPSGGWQAADRPRVTFARNKVLFKIYVVSDQSAAAVRSGRTDPAVEFLPAALPALDRCLAGEPPG